MHRFGSLVVLTAAAFAALGLTGSAGAAGSLVAPRASATAARTPSPQLALQRALALFAPGRVDAANRSAVRNLNRRDATLVLRDLVAARPALSRSDRRLADALLARPTDGANQFDFSTAIWNATARAHKKRFCNTHFCIHWTTRTNEAPSLTDKNPHNGRPDYIDKTIKNMNAVWSTEIGNLDYKKPLRDSDSGNHHGGNPNAKIDIFISNIGDIRLFGYCNSDDPSPGRQLSAYCVIDDNFSVAEFGTAGAHGNAANKVTLAHEFFHAVQFAYDFFDDLAVMEGTATWMEDQVFTSINDNRRYFNPSPIGPNPYAPLDLFEDSGTFDGWQYGTWIWYRFLSESLGAGSADKPVVIRQIWKQAIGSGSDNQGFGAIAAVLASYDGLKARMTEFGRWNSAPRKFYREGAGGLYPTAGATTITGNPPMDAGDFVDENFAMYRRSNRYVSVHPGSGVTHLTFSNMSTPTTAGTFRAIVFRTNGTVDAPVDPLTTPVVDFDATVQKVILVVTNPSANDFRHGMNQFHFRFDAS